MLITVKTNKQTIALPLEDIKIVLDQKSKSSLESRVLVYSLKKNENLGYLISIYGMSQDDFILYLSSHPEQYRIIEEEKEQKEQGEQGKKQEETQNDGITASN